MTNINNFFNIKVNLVIILGISFLANSCSTKRYVKRQKGDEIMTALREPAVAGSFYPGDKSTLRRMIESYLKEARSTKESKGQLVGFIAPHAGYVYSGQIAAYAYNLIKEKDYETVIIMGPSHRTGFKGASVYNIDNYKTPLGQVKIDMDIAEELIKSSRQISYVPQAHKLEHSVEVQVPFIQVVQPKALIVPMVIGSVSSQNCKKIARAIADAARKGRVLIIASSDMSHYHSYDEAVAMDKKVLQEIEDLAISDLNKMLTSGEGELCGGAPVMILMYVCEQLKAANVSVLKYANSGDVTGDKTQEVVGYSSIAFYKEPDTPRQADKTKPAQEQLTEKERKQLLFIARQTIEAVVNGEKIPEFKVTSSRLKEERGAFVTLHENAMLRGCIGRFIADKPLYEIISEVAVGASTQDPRFFNNPITPDDVDDLHIEISVLSPLQKVHSIDEIQLGVHGIYVMHQGSSGCFLPQVAVETGWTREQFLQHCCHDKAQVDKNAWKQGAELYKFTAEIFSEM